MSDRSAALLSLLHNGDILTADGAMGTMLQANGLSSSDCPEEWNVSHASVVQEIQSAYRKAGSLLILTNTFGGSPYKLSKFGLEARTEELNAAAARNARIAAGDGGFVMGDIGPTGEILEPYGEADPAAVRDGFRRQVRGLLEGGVDGFIVETMMDFEELRAAVEAIHGECDLPAIASLTFNVAPDGHRTMWGLSAADAARKMTDLPVVALGSNCGLSVEEYPAIVSAMKANTDKPIFVEPNAGMPHIEGDQTVFDLTPEAFAEGMRKVVAAGAQIVGGCCGTTPEHIAALCAALDL
ncbi:MAG: homocysteine S-methyltransferase family protein [bacterium]